METIFFIIDVDDISLLDFNENVNNKKFPQTSDAVISKLKNEYPSIRQISPQELVEKINSSPKFFEDKRVGIFYVYDLF